LIILFFEIYNGKLNWFGNNSKKNNTATDVTITTIELNTNIAQSKYFFSVLQSKFIVK